MFNEYYNFETCTYSTNPSHTEILRLDEMLTEAGIPHTLDRMFDGWQVCYPTNMRGPDMVMDVIQHQGSYGNSENKLEIMGLLTPEEEKHDSVSGWLTAEDAFERIRKHHAGEWDEYITSLSEPIPEDSFEETPPDISSTTISTTHNKPLTPEEFTKQMQEAFDVYYLQQDDEEEVHIVMDGIMCNLLRQLGYGDGVDIFNKTPMWYA